MRILSWNVNGFRAVVNNGFLEWLQNSDADVVCLQETRVLPEELTEDVRNACGYVSYWNPAVKKGYSGTAVYVKEAPRQVTNLGLEHFDGEGRVQALDYGDLWIVNTYWPNSQAERKRLDYKLEFVQEITTYLNQLVKRGKNVIICGDFNIAHTEIDLARPKENQNAPGFYREEREAMTQFLNAGYIDTFRHFVKEGGHYTWWSYRNKAREKNIGWRIDYHCINKRLLPRLRRAWIENHVYGSDHCPVGVEVA
jgi:exodeoxyribonuclease-3